MSGFLNQHNKLQSFCDENRLEVMSSFMATDLDCAYNIQPKGFTYKHEVTKSTFYVCFMESAYKEGVFSWDLEDGKTGGMNEDEFVAKLRQILASDSKYVSYAYKDHFVKRKRLQALPKFHPQ